MFNRKKSKPLAWFDTVLDAIPQKEEPKHRLRNSLIVIGLGLGSAVAAAAAKKGSEQ